MSFLLNKGVKKLDICSISSSNMTKETKLGGKRDEVRIDMQLSHPKMPQHLLVYFCKQNIINELFRLICCFIGCGVIANYMTHNKWYILNIQIILLKCFYAIIIIFDDFWINTKKFLIHRKVLYFIFSFYKTFLHFFSFYKYNYF